MNVDATFDKSARETTIRDMKRALDCVTPSHGRRNYGWWQFVPDNRDPVSPCSPSEVELARQLIGDSNREVGIGL